MGPRGGGAGKPVEGRGPSERAGAHFSRDLRENTEAAIKGITLEINLFL